MSLPKILLKDNSKLRRFTMNQSEEKGRLTISAIQPCKPRTMAAGKL
jgi:hypothetical protein